MKLLEEIKNDVMHLLLHVHSYNEKAKLVVEKSSNRYELAYEVIALNSIAQNIIVRISRLADKRKDVRSIKNLMKDSRLKHNKSLKSLSDDFETKSDPVNNIRHTDIAHMKTNDLSQYPYEPLPQTVLDAIVSLVTLVDAIEGKKVEYKFKVGSHEKILDLRESVSKGERVCV